MVGGGGDRQKRKPVPSLSLAEQPFLEWLMLCLSCPSGYIILHTHTHICRYIRTHTQIYVFTHTYICTREEEGEGETHTEHNTVVQEYPKCLLNTSPLAILQRAPFADHPLSYYMYTCSI